MEYFVFAILNILLFVNSVLAARYVAGVRGISVLPAAFVCGAGALVVSFEVLSLFFRIDTFHAAGAQAVLFVVLALITLSGRKSTSSGGASSSGSVTSLPGGGFSGSSGGSALDSSLSLKNAFSGPAVMLLVFGGLFVLFCSFALISPPAPSDAFLDHLVFPAEWLQAGRITLVQTLSPDQATTYYPSNAELVYLWLMLPVHNDIATGLLEPVCLLVCFFAAFRIGRRVGLGASWAAGAAALAACAPGVLNMTLQYGVDVFFAAGILCTIAFLLPDSDRHIALSDAAIAGLAAGLAAGAKYVGLVTLVFVAPLLFAGNFKRGGIRRIAIFVLCAAVTGGYWYIRNLAITGSALYPMGLDILGIEIMRGAFDRAAMYQAYLHIPVNEISYFANVMINYVFGALLLIAAGFVFIAGSFFESKTRGRILLFLFAVSLTVFIVTAYSGFSGFNSFGSAIIAATLVLAAVVIFGSVQRENWWRGYILSAGALLFFAFWFINPYNTANNHRFLAPAVFLLMLFVGQLMERRGWRWMWWVFPAVILAVNYDAISRILGFLWDSFGKSANNEWFATGVRVWIPAIFVSILMVRTLLCAVRGRKINAAIFGAILAVVFSAWFLPQKAAFMENGRYQWYAGHYLGPAWASISEIDIPVTIAYAGNCSPYGLYGDELKNRVLYINTDGSPDRVFHHYENELRTSAGYSSPEESVGLNYIFRSTTDYNEWIIALENNGVDVLFVTREWYRGLLTDPQELIWAREHPDRFVLLRQAGDAYIFKFMK